EGAGGPVRGGAQLGSNHEVVGAGRVGQSAVHREGAAGAVRGARAPRGDAAVVLDRPVPDLADVVAVDLGLELDPAVVGLRLQLPDGGPAAAAVGAALRPAGGGPRRSRGGCGPRRTWPGWPGWRWRERWPPAAGPGW